MGKGFDHLIEQIPQDVYSQVKALISEKIAIFRPKSFIIDKAMCSQDYNFILPSSNLPPAVIGNHEYQLRRNSLIAIGSGVRFMCSTYAPTREYVNIMIDKQLFETVGLDVTGKKAIEFPNVEYPRSQKLLRIITDLEQELTYYGNSCPQMIQGITEQLIIQLLRDTDNYYRMGAQEADEAMDYRCVSELYRFVNPAYVKMLMCTNHLLPRGANLTRREIEIAALLLERLDYHTIASKLFISPNTLKTHVKHIYDKLKVANRKEMGTKVYGLRSDDEQS